MHLLYVHFGEHVKNNFWVLECSETKESEKILGEFLQGYPSVKKKISKILKNYLNFSKGFSFTFFSSFSSFNHQFHAFFASQT